MSKTMPAVDVVLIGGGWTGSVVGKELAANGQRVVVLERGQPRWTSPDFQAPGVRDELNYTRRHELHQNAASEPYTFRNRADETALPMRRWQFAYPANHLGGAGVHWSGAYYRWDPVEFKLRSHYTQRYGARIFEAGITAQDWPLTYDEIEPYYDRFDRLVGASVWLTESQFRVNALGFLSQHLVVLLDPARIVDNLHSAYRRRTDFLRALRRVHDGAVGNRGYRRRAGPWRAGDPIDDDRADRGRRGAVTVRGAAAALARGAPRSERRSGVATFSAQTISKSDARSKSAGTSES